MSWLTVSGTFLRSRTTSIEVWPRPETLRPVVKIRRADSVLCADGMQTEIQEADCSLWDIRWSVRERLIWWEGRIWNWAKCFDWLVLVGLLQKRSDDWNFEQTFCFAMEFRHINKLSHPLHKESFWGLDYCACDIPKYSFLGHFPLGNLPCAAYHQRMAGTAAE